MRRLWIASLVAGAILASLLVTLLATWGSHRPSELAPGANPQATSKLDPPSPALLRPAAIDTENSETLARWLADLSLFGTEPDGALVVDARGNLVVNIAIRRLFDFFLTLTGEVPLAEITRYLEIHLRERLPPQGAEQALALWRRYLQYRRSSRELYGDGELATQSLEDQLTAMSSLRERIFGSEHAAALFGEEQQTQRVDLERYRALADPELSLAERRDQFAALEQMLPESVRAARAESRVHLDLRQAEAALKEAQDPSPEALRDLRVQWVGAEAADRLEALDRARAQWNQRLESYISALRDLEVSGEADAPSRAALLAEHFEPHERLRAQALERSRRPKTEQDAPLP